MPNFIDKKDFEQIKDEIMLFAYFAGHGCQQAYQEIILNEDNVKNAFWPVEA